TCGGGVLVDAQEFLADQVLVAGALLGYVGHAGLAAPVDHPGGAVSPVFSREVAPGVDSREPVVRPGVRHRITGRAAVDLGGPMVPRAGGVIGPGHHPRDELIPYAAPRAPSFSIPEGRPPARVLERPPRPPAGAVVDGQRRRKPLADELPACRRIE